MGISSELARMPVANGDGITKAFDYDFRILSAADLKVIVIASDGAAVTQTYPTHYAVTGVGDDAGGTVVFTTAPAETDTVLIVLDPAITQLVDFTSDTYENAFDRLTLMMKRAIDIASRALRVSDHDTTNLNDLEVTLGNDKILGTNSSGEVTALTLADIDGLVSVTAPLTYSGGVLGLSSTAPLNNSEATSPPTTSHDSSLGYSYHSRWGGPTLDEVWVCIDASVGAAIWVLFTGALASLDTVDTAEIEDDAVTLAELEHGTSGDILYYGASGEPFRLAKGDDGEVLKLNGGLPSWMNQQDCMFIQDVKAVNTDGGGFTSGAARTRDLNTVVKNTISGASLSSNQFTLPAGEFIIRATAPAYLVDQHIATLKNITDGTVEAVGTTEQAYRTAYVQSRSNVWAFVTLVSPKAFELQHTCAYTNATNGLGDASNIGLSNIYSQVYIEKVGQHETCQCNKQHC